MMGCPPESAQTLWGNLWVSRCLSPRAARFLATLARASSPGIRPLARIVAWAWRAPLTRRIQRPHSGVLVSPMVAAVPARCHRFQCVCSFTAAILQRRCQRRQGVECQTQKSRL